MTKRIIATIVSVLLIMLGVHSLSLSKQGVGELDIYSGPLKLISNAYDPDFDIEVESPFLKREVEMYQFYENKQGFIKTDFFPEKVIGDNFINPDFPSDIKNAIFYGDVTIGNENIHLDEGFLEKFSFSSYVDFSKENIIYQVTGLPDIGEVKGLHLVDTSYYTDGTAKKWEVGDILVTWEAMDPSDFASTYTAAGQLEGDKLVAKDSASEFFYDQELTAEEIAKKYENSSFYAAIFFIGLGVVILLITYIPGKAKEIKNKIR
ncbi:MAG: hypothetical protein Q4E09_00635 [Eubacteriales bacterium]|nr:hypothetical protein [Eubacteriales bacterium]